MTSAQSPMSARHFVLEVERLSVRIGANDILRNVSFRVEAGSLLAILGPNGSGKTMLLRALIGRIPHNGTVRWAPGTRIGYVPQRLDLDRDLPLTGGDLLRARARLASAGRGEIDQAVRSVGLTTAVLGTLLGALSGGQLQRLLMAFALLAAPTVLLLDEPTASVDEPGQEHLNETIRRLQIAGTTVLLISHDLSVVSRFATDVLCLTRNHTCFGAPRHVLTPEILAEVYGEPVGFVTHVEGAHDLPRPQR